MQKDPQFGLLLERQTLITSKTNLKGFITYCNQDFLRYSKYNESEIIDAPHSIVRHKDMPRCVFKLLWDYVQGGKEIFAFVKNLNKYKEFYWVFANITPSYDDRGQIIGYYSVRRQPNFKVIPTISELYQNLCALEASGGMQQSLKALDDFITKQGKSYNQIICELQEQR